MQVYKGHVNGHTVARDIWENKKFNSRFPKPFMVLPTMTGRFVIELLLGFAPRVLFQLHLPTPHRYEYADKNPAACLCLSTIYT